MLEGTGAPVDGNDIRRVDLVHVGETCSTQTQALFQTATPQQHGVTVIRNMECEVALFH